MTDMARLLIAGEWADGASTSTVRNPYDAEPVASVAVPSRDQVDRAITALAEAQAARVLYPYERFEILSRAARLLQERRGRFIDAIVAESGFTSTDADTEVGRAVQTLLVSGEEAKRLDGEMVPLDGAPGVTDRLGFTVRVPLGVVCAITPFNSPLNTVAHKIAPALAAGNSVVLKPASPTPVTAVRLVELLLDAGLPASHLALLHGAGGTVGQWLLEDDRIGFYTFTGSTAVGEAIHRTVGLRRTQLELGSISCTIVCDDAPLERTVSRCVNAAFRKAGQVCTSVQRLYVHERVLDDIVEGIVADLATKQVGDPADPSTFVGPLISRAEAERVERWVADARAGGAKLLAGGGRDGSVVDPAVLLGVRSDMQVMCEEVFGPVLSIVPFDDVDRAVDEVNATPYGLAAGIFTADLNRALHAARRLRMGSVHINETSSSRVDLMPYGGVKDSGFGKEGPRYAAREMTEERLITISLY